MHFEVGGKYTRKDIQDLLRVPGNRRGGIWDTGYTRYDAEVYVFCNIGIAGSTGHDYPNRWDHDELVWFGKNGSTVGQPLIKAMVSGAVPVHFFWRSQEYRSFTYAGIGRTVNVRDSSPVEVRWRLPPS
jgi:putative restriction endonuclease